MRVMFRTSLLSIFFTSAAFAAMWTLDDDGKVYFDNFPTAVDAGPLGAGSCCGDEGSSHPSLSAMVRDFD